jgi:ABC-type microcin C transport system permease subunit YejE
MTLVPAGAAGWDSTPTEATTVTIAADASSVEPLVERRHPVHSARLGFRNWRRSRPFWAGVWAMLGGALIAYVPGTALKLVLIANASLLIGTLVGVVVGFFGLMLWFARSFRVVLGVLILLLSLCSFFTSDFGGLLLGMLMGFVGGSLALAWVPTKVTWRQRRRARKAARAGAPAAAVTGPQLPEPDSSAELQTDEQLDAPSTPDLADVLLGAEDTETPTSSVDRSS